MPTATQRNARDLKPDILRNEIVEFVDQMERIEAGGDGMFASAMSEFPLVNLDDPDEEWYVMDGVRSPMDATSFGAESPIGTLDMPERDGTEVQAYKKKYRPDKGAETEFSRTPFSVYQRAAAILRMEIFLTREQITWRGDQHIDGLTGRFGDTPHPDIAADHVFDGVTAWSDSVNSSPYDNLTNAAYEVRNNGTFIGANLPNVYLSPSVARDLKQADDMQDRLSGVMVQNVTTEAMQRILDEEIGNVFKVAVYVPRTDANGNYLDESNNVVDSPDDAAQDNVLEPYDPSAGTVHRNVIVGRPGNGSAYVPWYSDRLLERANSAPDPGSVSVDNQNGFFTQVWNEHDPMVPNFKAGQEIGFKLQRPENWAIIHDV